MAWLVQRGNMYHVAFRIGNSEFRKSLRTRNRRTAESAMHRVEDNLRDLELGRIEVPEGADIATYLLSNGQRVGKVRPAATPKLGRIFDEYKQSLPKGALEDRTLATTDIHMKHVFECFGRGIVFSSLDTKRLQDYVNRRSRKHGPRGNPISGTTIRKEVATLRMLWSFARDRNYVTGSFPMRGVRFPKVDAKEPFKTYAEIMRCIKRAELSTEEQEKLWECLYLTVSEIEELLDFVQKNARYGFLYPMVVAAAHTGARRSELVRARIDDFDIAGGTFTIRERKRNRNVRTTRMVRISSRLKTAMQHWFGQHPGGNLAFYPGHINRGPSRGIDYFTVDQAHYHLEKTLDGKWSVLRGWHVLRHSFASNLASQAVDQRIIDAWMGHQTAEMRKRYQHLVPDAQQSAMQAVFG
jgi:integrase